ncbi:MAG: superfamily II DNA or RNA helicase [Acidimicrobiales bacterium]|jgi:superfamily II DNA or RNA helicase
MAGATLKLRPWQREALDRYEQSPHPDFLAVATPGAGKTTFALTAARLSLPTLPGRLIIVAPTRHLKEQWADAAERFGLHLDSDWSPAAGLPADLHGVVTTYQQVGTSAESFVSLARDGFVVLDEIHHAGDERSWGEGVRTAFGSAAKRLSLSGTPFRSDTLAIPFVRYVNDQVVPDVEYGYGDALADGRVVRPVFFPRFGGHMEWMAPDGSQVAASFDDALTRTLANQRLRAALSLEGDWLPSVLGHAHQQLMRLREQHPDAGGLVIAMDQTHAQQIAALLRSRFGVNPTVAVSDDPDASDKIAQFAASTSPWIVAVRMVSEGVDIPRLRVGVYATTTTTELFFRQAVGRIVRWTGGRGSTRAFLFVPDDARLRHWANEIKEVRRHLLVRSSDVDSDDERRAQELAGELDPLQAESDEQLSLFMVLSATATDPPTEFGVFDDSNDVGEAEGEAEVEDERLLIDLMALPLPAIGLGHRRADRKERDRLRQLNADLARQLVVETNRTHAAVNSELNRLAGLSKVSSATVEQLERRARAAEQWLGRNQKRARMARFV